MPIGVYLNFNGNCREAAGFYENAFKTEKPRILTYGDAPGGGADLPDDVKNLVLHAELKLAGDTVRLSDVPPDRPVAVGGSVCVVAELKTEDQVRSVFAGLKEGGTVLVEVQETFFNSCYAFLTDKFGISWQLMLDNTKD